MTAEEANDFYYSARCPECGSLWFHEPHKDDCSIGRQQKQQIEDAKRLMRGQE
jgi:hypothetical protein